MVDYKKTVKGPEIPPTIKDESKDELRVAIFSALLSGGVVKYGLPWYSTTAQHTVATRVDELMRATENILLAIDQNLEKK